MEMTHLKVKKIVEKQIKIVNVFSGDGNFFGCNDGSSNSIDTNRTSGAPGMGFPVMISNDNIYVRDGNGPTATGPDTALSTVACDAGDALISGTSNSGLSEGSALASINHFLRQIRNRNVKDSWG